MAGVTLTLIRDTLTPALERVLGDLPQLRGAIQRRTALDVVARVAETTPVVSGRLRAGWRASSAALMGGGGGEGEGSVEADGDTLFVTNAVEYAAAVEYGTATRPPGNHLAVAVEEAKRELQQELADLFGERLAEHWGGG